MKISVIIPMYGVENYIARCARSLFEQTFTSDVEFLFIDDASKDRSSEVLATVIDEYAEKNLDVKIFRHEKNQGLPSARNTGLKHARGEFVMHVDGDDFWRKTPWNYYIMPLWIIMRMLHGVTIISLLKPIKGFLSNHVLIPLRMP